MQSLNFKAVSLGLVIAFTLAWSPAGIAAKWLNLADLPGVRVADKAERAGFKQRFGHAQIAYYFEDADTRVLVHDGDLNVDGNLANGEIVFVTGNLSVSGNYHDYKDSIGVLMVAGNMQVDNLYSWGALHVGKDLNAKGLVLTVYNDFSFVVEGKVNARALVVKDKSGGYTLGTTKAEISDNAKAEQHAMALRSLLPKFFTNPDELEREAGDVLSYDYLGFDDGMAEKLFDSNEPLFRAQIAPATLIADADLALAPDTPVNTLLTLLPRDTLLAQLVASNPQLDTALHAPLLALNDSIVNEWLAINASQVVLGKLNDSALTQAVAEHLITEEKPSAEVIARLAASKNADVRGVLAGGPELDAKLANQLANDADSGVRFHAVRAQRYLLSAETIAARVVDADPFVRDVIAHVSLTFAQSKALIPNLSGDGVNYFAESLQKLAIGAQPSLMSMEEHIALAQILLDTAKLADVKDAYLVLPEPQQLALFDALTKAERLDIGHVAENTRSVAVMQKIADLAIANAQAIPEDLAKNPRLPLNLQRLIFEKARDDENSTEYAYGASPVETLSELLGQASMDQSLVDDCVALAIERNELPDDSGGIHHALFGRKLSPANLARLDEVARGSEDWSLILMLQPHATPEQLRTALPRWYEDNAELHAELKAQSAKNGAAFFAALVKAKSPELREVAAINFATPAESLAELVDDANDDVADAARTNPNLPRAQRFDAAKALLGSEFPI